MNFNYDREKFKNAIKQSYNPDVIYGYESPMTGIINKVTNDIIEERENMITAKVNEVLGLDIDKEELIKALRYDRDEYDRAYREGYKQGRRNTLKILYNVIKELLEDE